MKVEESPIVEEVRRRSRELSARFGDDLRAYAEHLRAYGGTDRAPVPPPPHRSHHYEVSC